MERYDYLQAITDDVIEYIEENVDLNDYEDRESLEEFLNDELWAEDSVTGNASGSYYCNAWKAEEAICHNMDLLADALREFGCDDAWKYLESAESADVTIRCYLLGQAIGEALDQIYAE